ncbi:MAG: hypothetical protein CMH85_01260 [Novosphingobium sp.]|nr:hypothetical protein [Novosphingobium sp.]
MPGDIRQRFDAPNWVKVLDKLKLSATSKNWRYYPEQDLSIAHGAWRLKSEWSREGEPHANLHRNLSALHEFCRFEHVLYEKALTPEQRGGASNPGNDILLELIGHVKSFYCIKRCRTILGLHRASWQKGFIGPQKRGTKRKTILELIQERARQLGFTFRKDDEAAAIGLLTYGLLTRNMQPPWLLNEVLRPQLTGAPA